MLFLLQSVLSFFFFFFKQKTAYEMRISDWSSDVCCNGRGSSDHESLANGKRTCFRKEWSTSPLPNCLPLSCRHGEPASVDARKRRLSLSPPSRRRRWTLNSEVRARGYTGRSIRSEERRVGKEWVSKGRLRW